VQGNCCNLTYYKSHIIGGLDPCQGAVSGFHVCKHEGNSGPADFLVGVAYQLPPSPPMVQPSPPPPPACVPVSVNSHSAQIQWKLGMGPCEQSVNITEGLEAVFSWGGFHHVLQVPTSKAFASCNETDGTEVAGRSIGGNWTFRSGPGTFYPAGTYYFICAVHEGRVPHCQYRQRVTITVLPVSDVVAIAAGARCSDVAGRREPSAAECRNYAASVGTVVENAETLFGGLESGCFQWIDGPGFEHFTNPVERACQPGARCFCIRPNQSYAPAPSLPPPLPPPPLPPPPSPAPSAPAPPPDGLQSCVCGSSPTEYATFNDQLNCFAASDITNLEVIYSGISVSQAVATFYGVCADYDNDGTVRANDLTNMKRYYAGLLPISSHFSG